MLAAAQVQGLALVRAPAQGPAQALVQGQQVVVAAVLQPRQGQAEEEEQPRQAPGAVAGVLRPPLALAVEAAAPQLLLGPAGAEAVVVALPLLQVAQVAGAGAAGAARRHRHH